MRIIANILEFRVKLTWLPPAASWSSKMLKDVASFFFGEPVKSIAATRVG